MTGRLRPRRATRRRTIYASAMALMIGTVCVPVTAAVAVAHSAGPAGLTVQRPDGAALVYATTGAQSAQNPAFSPDGRTLIFTRYLNGYDAGTGPGGGLLKVAAGGGTATPLYDKDEATNVNGLAAWNAVSGRVAFAVASGNGDIATANPDGTGYTRVTTAANPHTYLEPTWSHDGQWLAFEDDQSTASDLANRASIVLAHPDGSGLHVIVNGPTTATDNRLPVWSPDGTRILFQRRTNLATDVYDLFTVRPDGTGLIQITHGDNCDSDASWSPDGRWILDSACFAGYGSIPHPNIFLVRADDGEVVRVTNNVGGEDGAPAMSPDGQWIYFESHKTADEMSPTQIWHIRAPVRSDGSTQIYRPTQALYSAQNPCYAPNSNQLLFTIFTNGYNNDPNRPGSATLNAMAAQGGAAPAVVSHVGNSAVNMPGTCFSASAGRIAYSSDLVNTDNIWTSIPSGVNNGEQQVTCYTSGILHAQEPTWSADGKWLVYELDNDNAPNQTSIWKIPASSRCNNPTAPVRIVPCPTCPSSPASDNHQPAWSPDGTRIVFQRQTSFPNGPINVWTVNPDGTGLTHITNDANSDTDASWSPDSRSIVYSTDYTSPTGDANLFTVTAIAGGTRTRLTSQCSYDGAPSWSPDGKWVSFESWPVPNPGQNDIPTAIWRIPATIRPGSPPSC